MEIRRPIARGARSQDDDGNALPSADTAGTRPQLARSIELFGPSGAGKTTLARELESALRAKGTAVRVFASARPRENDDLRKGRLAHLALPLVAPLARASKLPSILAGAVKPSSVDPRIQQLIALLPPGSWMRSLRLRRYLERLWRFWNNARTSNDVVIIEQGFVNVLSSLALYAEKIDRRALAQALLLVPEPDLLVYIHAPREVLQMRLQERQVRQTALERLIENDIDISLHQVELAEVLSELLVTSGRPAMRVSCVDPAGLKVAVDAISREIETRTRPKRLGDPTAPNQHTEARQILNPSHDQ